jgi:hypothetical protein
MLKRDSEHPEMVGDTQVAEGWWIETHMLGCRMESGTPLEMREDDHWRIHDE